MLMCYSCVSKYTLESIEYRWIPELSSIYDKIQMNPFSLLYDSQCKGHKNVKEDCNDGCDHHHELKGHSQTEQFAKNWEHYSFVEILTRFIGFSG